MAFIESHEELENHPKVIDLSGRMGWDRDQTIGKLHRFWWWCLKYAPTGDLHKFNDSQLAGSVGLNASDGDKFVGSMVASRWIDREPGVFRVHDWIIYAGTYLRGCKFKRQPAKWREVQAVYGDRPGTIPEQSQNNPRTVRGLSRIPTNQPTNQPTKPTVAATAAVGDVQADPVSQVVNRLDDPFTVNSLDRAKIGKLIESEGLAATLSAIDIANRDADLRTAKGIIGYAEGIFVNKRRDRQTAKKSFGGVLVREDN